MPVETRHIFFSMTEAASAIIEYHRWKKESFAPFGVDTIEMQTEPDIAVIVKAYKDDTKSSTEPHEFHSDLLSTALVLFCINRKIPLPVEGKKAIRAGKDGVVLMIYLGTLPPRREGAARK